MRIAGVELCHVDVDDPVRHADRLQDGAPLRRFAR
jgi:hypothetical protein